MSNVRVFQVNKYLFQFSVFLMTSGDDQNVMILNPEPNKGFVEYANFFNKAQLLSIINEPEADDPTYEFAMNLVAVVSTKDSMDINKRLETAYALTNSLEFHWSQNDCVSTKRENCRSTSVGDLMYDEELERYYVVNSFGFTEVKMNPRAFHKFFDFRFSY